MTIPLVGLKASTEETNGASSSSLDKQDQYKLKRVAIIAVAAVLLIGLIFLEVKYRTLSIGVKMILTSPFVMGVIGGILLVVALTYLARRYLMRPSQEVACHPPHQEIPPEISVYTDQTIRTARERVFDDGVPASMAEYREALNRNRALIDYLRREFPRQGIPLEQAQIDFRTRYFALERVVSETDIAYLRARSITASSDAGLSLENAKGALDDLITRRPLALRYLITQPS